MTKEQLEKEAIAKYKTGSYPQLHPDHYAFIHGYLAGAEPREKKIEELEQENAKLKKEYSDNLSLKDEELMCLETEFNTYKSEAKDHIKKLLDCLKQDTSDPQTNYYVCQYMDKAEQFLKEIEENG